MQHTRQQAEFKGFSTNTEEVIVGVKVGDVVKDKLEN